MAVEEMKKESEVTMARGVSTEGPVTREEMRTLLRGEAIHVPGRTWTPTTGGLLGIIAGYLNILTGFLLVVGVQFFAGFASFIGFPMGFGLGALLIALGVVSLIGGAFALRRRVWGMALAGSITALFPSLAIVPGTLSLIFVTLGKPEFRK